MKTLIRVLLAFQMIWAPDLAHAVENPVDDTRFNGATTVLNGFFSRLNTDSPMWTGPQVGVNPDAPISGAQAFFGETVANGEMLSQMVATQIVALEPLDFNGFVLYMMYDYTIHPERRKNYLPFISMIHDFIAGELANTASLQAGWQETVPIKALEKSSSLFLTALAMGTVYNIWRRGRGTIFMQAEARGVTAAGRAGFMRRLGTGVTHPAVWTAIAGGTFLGFEEWKREVSKVAKMDPLVALKVVQAELACNLSYAGLDIEDRVEAIRKNNQLALTEADQLIKDIQTLHDQASVLLEQEPTLEKLSFSDPLFQENYGKLPAAQNWSELRTFIAARIQSGETRCSEVSMDRLVTLLENQTLELVQIYSNLPLPEEQAQ